MAATLAVRDSEELGRYLSDHSGRAVYAPAGGQNVCAGACAEAWPPVPGGDSPFATDEPALQSELIGSVTRPDGTTQLTYAKHPLHYRGPSERPGSPEREVTDEFGRWSLLFPHGALIAPP